MTFPIGGSLIGEIREPQRNYISISISPSPLLENPFADLTPWLYYHLNYEIKFI